MDVPDIGPPYSTGLGVTAGSGTNTWDLANGNFYVNGDFTINNNQTLYISGNATLYVTGNFKMKNNTGCYISIAPGATFKLYIGTTTGTAVAGDLGMVNTTGNDSSFQLYGLPTLTTLTWNGNAAFLGTVYAPESSFTLGGGGSSPYDFQGAITVKSISMNGGFSLHYDQNLRRFAPSSGFTVASWREL